MKREIERYAWKVEAGADFAVTQPVFDPAGLDRFLEQTDRWRIPVLAGIWPLVSLRNAEFLANEVPGVHVPEAVIKRMAKAQERGAEAALAEGKQIAIEMLDAVSRQVQGVHISTPMAKIAVAIDLLQTVRATT